MWTELCADTALASALNPAEAAATAPLLAAGQGGIDALCADIAARIRAAVLAGGRARLQGGPRHIPASLRGEAVAILRLRLLTRFDLAVSEARKAEADAAEARLDAIARGEIPLLDESAADTATPPPTYTGRVHRWQSPRNSGLM